MWGKGPELKTGIVTGSTYKKHSPAPGPGISQHILNTGAEGFKAAEERFPEKKKKIGGLKYGEAF